MMELTLTIRPYRWASMPGRALGDAMAAGEVHIDPFDLLTRLDNAALWWLCKHHAMGSLNLQIVQTVAPDFFALFEAIEAIASGECDRVLVGGAQTRAQGAVQLAAEGERLTSEDTERLVGGATFVLLEREPARAPWGRLCIAGGPAPPAAASKGRDGRRAPALGVLDAIAAWCWELGDGGRASERHWPNPIGGDVGIWLREGSRARS